ncbi:hypothetical protein [Hyalangium rubrum]|uniref:Lipoprotein n=1 Tax=Hyalangium rubrum TaxID=3103134 RepID=A0ABU5GWR6_9BACT|nr:hypothetical protein [Hyalangium sp. s54d21]MDY7225633.1 hypothetical protein [Hyalangium sp. s54d21]
MMTLITGCSSKCEAVCSEANACGITERSTDVDCPEFCNDVEEFNSRAVAAGQQSCDAQFQAHLDCWESNSSQMCSTEFKGCEESGTAWTECMAAHCAAVAEDENATDPNCFGADPALYPF